MKIDLSHLSQVQRAIWNIRDDIDDINRTFNDCRRVWNNSFPGGIVLPALTPGSVLFINAANAIAEDNANFFWDDAQNFLGLGTNTPATTLEVNGDITVGDADWIGNALASARLAFDSSGSPNNAYFANCEVAIGTTNPSNWFDIAFTEDPVYAPATIYDFGGMQISNNSTVNNTPAIINFTNRSAGTAHAAIVSLSPSVNNSELAFLTEASNVIGERVRISPAGLVGVGTDSPAQLIEVADTDADPIIRIDYENTDNAGDPQMQYAENGTAIFSTGIDTANSNRFVITPNATVGGNTSLVMLTTGLVGINCATPAQLLEVAHASSDPIIRIDYENTNNAGDPQLQFAENGTAVASIGVDTGNSNRIALIPAATIGGNTHFCMRVTGNYAGNIGINIADAQSHRVLINANTNQQNVLTLRTSNDGNSYDLLRTLDSGNTPIDAIRYDGGLSLGTNTTAAASYPSGTNAYLYVDMPQGGAASRECVFVMKVSDSNSEFGCVNLTSTNGRFQPTFYGYNNDDNRAAINFFGLVGDGVYSGDYYPALAFGGFRRNTSYTGLSNQGIVAFVNTSNVSPTIRTKFYLWHDGQCEIGSVSNLYPGSEPSANLILRSPNTGYVGLIIRQSNGQTADTMQCTDNTGAVYVAIDDEFQLAVGHATPDRRLHPQESDAATNTVLYPFRVSRVTTSAPAVGIGVGMEWEVESDGGNHVSGITENIYTDETNGNEDSDFIWKLMEAGAAAAERARLTSGGDFKITNDYYSGGNQGLSGTLTLDDGANWRITLTFTGGILTGQTTGASVGATATWV